MHETFSITQLQITAPKRQRKLERKRKVFAIEAG